MSDRNRKYPHMTLCAECGKNPPVESESLCAYCKHMRREQRRLEREATRVLYDPEAIGIVFKGTPDPVRKAARLARARIQRAWAAKATD